jgi:formyltetrahydrofolate synthetase
VDYYYDAVSYQPSENAEVVVEVIEYPNRKFLSFRSSNIDINNISATVPVVVSKYYEAQSVDLSDENKYEITTYTTSRIHTSTLMIYLNRNNGQIIVTSEYTRTGKGTNQTSINGTCERIDVKKKKF